MPEPQASGAVDIERRLARWTAAGIVDAATAERIRAFERVQAGTRRWNWPVWLALGFGATALGAGVLLFVSAHWDELSPAFRFTLVLVLVGAFHLAGAWLATRFAAMADTLHLLGTVALGGGIFLAGQIFNLDEHWPGGLLLWTVGAAIAWGLLRAWPQLVLLAMLAPAWLAAEWFVAAAHTNDSVIVNVIASGMTLLGLAYVAAPLPATVATVAATSTTAISAPERQVLAKLGGWTLPFALIGLAVASSEPDRGADRLSMLTLAIGWTVALAAPLALAAWLRGRRAWPLAAAALWIVIVLNIERAAGEVVLYAWWALGAVALAAWGVADGRVDRINLGAGAFAATVITFFFSRVMDKLDRAASLIVLGIVLLGTGWAIERARRQLVQRARAASINGAGEEP